MLNVGLEEHLYGYGTDDDLVSLILTASQTAIEIRNELPYKMETAKTHNIFGETQKAIDVWADEELIDAFRKSALIKNYGSEEQDGVIPLNDNGKYYVRTDPMDGSSVLVKNNPVGTIISVYDKDGLLEGKYQVAAMYFLYSSLFTFVCTTGKGVHEYIYMPKKREFVLQRENINLPEKGKFIGIAGPRRGWLSEEFRKFVEDLEREEDLKPRYTGCFVLDINHQKEGGGFFGYPTFKDRPHGKLRLDYELKAMAKIIEEAGGASSDGKRSLLEIKPTSPYQTSPAFLGNDYLIERLEKTLNE